MTKRIVKTTTKKTNKAAAVTNVKAASKQATTAAPVATDKADLAKAFAKAAPHLRCVFQAKFTKLDLSKHTSAQSTARDEAFIKALRTVYGTKPFSHRQTGADTGNMARAIHIGYVKATGKANADGEALYTATPAN